MNKILILEDDPDITEIIKLALAGRYLVTAATDNEDLLLLLDDFRPDLILIDYYIGQKKAPEIMELVRSREIYKDLPVILFSGHHDIQRLAGGMGAIAFLAKPFNLVDLYSTLEKAFKKADL